ncbi:MAG: hypothetical protein ACRDNT_14255 [Streptosporangiaceae bacterium]
MTALASLSGVVSVRHPPDLCREAGRGDLAAEGGHRRRVDRREAERHRPGRVAQLAPRQLPGEQDEQMPAAGGRDIGGVPGAETLEQLAEPGGLSVKFRCQPGAPRGQILTAGFDNAARVEVEGEQAAGGGALVIDRHRARLRCRRAGGQRPGMPGGVGAAAVL